MNYVFFMLTIFQKDYNGNVRMFVYIHVQTENAWSVRI